MWDGSTLAAISSMAHLTTSGTGNGAFAGLAAMAMVRRLTLEATECVLYEDRGQGL